MIADLFHAKALNTFVSSVGTSRPKLPRKLFRRHVLGRRDKRNKTTACWSGCFPVSVIHERAEIEEKQAFTYYFPHSDEKVSVALI